MLSTRALPSFVGGRAKLSILYGPCYLNKKSGLCYVRQAARQHGLLGTP